MTDACRWGMRTTLLALGFWLLTAAGDSTAADSKGPIVPDADYPKLIDQQLKVLDEALKALKPAKDLEEIKKLSAQARCAAVMIAAVAQDNLAGKDGAQRASLRDAALRVAALVKTKKVDDAIKAAADLKNVKADAKAKMEKIKLFDVHIDLPETMSQFKLVKARGQGIESLLFKLGQDKKRMVPPAAATDAVMQALYQTILVADLVTDYVPPKNAKAWKSHTADMRFGAVDMVEKLRAKDGKGAFTDLSKLNTSCSACHKEFRD
jgi:hypothetical protein